MSQAERWQLARMLTEVDGPGPAGPAPSASPDPYLRDPRLGRQRRLVLFISAGCCVILAGWIVVLAATLPHHFNAHHWRALWVNFDVLLLAAFALTAWATWRKRQVLILLLMLTGTMLCCDAWFDVGTSLATSSMWLSIGRGLRRAAARLAGLHRGAPPAQGHGRGGHARSGPGPVPGQPADSGRADPRGRAFAASYPAGRRRARRGVSRQPRA